MLGGALACVVVALVAIALGGGDDDPPVPVPSVLASVCSQSNVTLAPDVIEITEPIPGAGVSSPLTVKGSINALGGTFFISLVTADGSHVIDYPVQSSQSDSLVPFEQQIPFSYFEQVPACVWVYRENIDSAESIRIPVVIQPQTSPTIGAE
jgi:hypothetical protein